MPPLEIKQDQTLYNYQSLRGVPIPTGMVGSDSRLIPYPNNTGPSENPATTNQFSGLISYGGVAAPGNASGLVSGMSYTANAQNIELPRGENGVTGLVLSRAQVGAPFSTALSPFSLVGSSHCPMKTKMGSNWMPVCPLKVSGAGNPIWQTGRPMSARGITSAPTPRSFLRFRQGPFRLPGEKCCPKVFSPPTPVTPPNGWKTVAISTAFTPSAMWFLAVPPRSPRRFTGTPLATTAPR